MTAIELLNLALKETGTMQRDAAGMIGYTPTQLNRRIMTGTLRANEWLKILELIGATVDLTNENTGVRFYSSKDERTLSAPVKGMVSGVKYNTEKSILLSSSFFCDGANKYTDGQAQELYIDSKGRYFFVGYDEGSEDKPEIIAVPSNVASAFIERYGLISQK